MKLKEFFKLKTIPNYFLFYGDEFFLDLYQQKVLELIKDSNSIKLYFDEYDFEVAKNHLSQNSLFGDKNSIVIRSDKFPQNIDKLIDIVGDNYLYLFYNGDIKKAKTNYFKNNFVRFFRPDLKELIIYANNYLAKYNKHIDIETLKYLIKRIDYRFLFRELDKLILIDYVNKQVIDKLIFDFNETTFDEVFDLLFLRQNYLSKLNYLLEQGVDEIRIITSLNRYVKTLYKFYLYMQNFNTNNISKEVLGYQLPFDLENKRVKIVYSLKEEDFYKIFKILLKAELSLKNSKDKEAILLATIIEIKQYLESNGL